MRTHIGHYLGLALFGFESIDSRDLPVYATDRMAGFLRANGPWSLLVSRRNIELRRLLPGTAVELEPELTVMPFTVPHRDELSDTVGFVVRGPHRILLYVPDTDSWAAWRVPLPRLLRSERVDVALLDGTFHGAAELPDRDVRKIGHPLMTDTAALLGDAVPRQRHLRVYFTHLKPLGPNCRRLSVPPAPSAPRSPPPVARSPRKVRSSTSDCCSLSARVGRPPHDWRNL